MKPASPTAAGDTSPGFRVLWVVEDASRRGGVESVVRALSQLFAERGVESDVLSWSPAAAQPTVNGSRGWFASKLSAARSRNRRARAAGKAVRERLAADPELVAVIDFGSAAIARHLRDVPRWGVHVHWAPELVLAPWRHFESSDVSRVLLPLVMARLWWVSRGSRRALAAAPFVVTLTESHATVFRSVTPTVRQIENPVDAGQIVHRSTPRARADLLIGCVGRIAWEKGVDVLVEALALAPLQPGVRVVIAGSGPAAVPLSRRTQDLGLPEVEFVGWVEEPRALLEEVDVLVLPSRLEAVPLVLLEALSAGCLVVAADAGGGVRDLLAEGRLGRIVPTQNPRALRNALEAALDDVRAGRRPPDDELREQLRRHEPSVVVDAWFDLLSDQTAG